MYRLIGGPGFDTLVESAAADITVSQTRLTGIGTDVLRQIGSTYRNSTVQRSSMVKAATTRSSDPPRPILCRAVKVTIPFSDATETTGYLAETATTYSMPAPATTVCQAEPATTSCGAATTATRCMAVTGTTPCRAAVATTLFRAGSAMMS